MDEAMAAYARYLREKNNMTDRKIATEQVPQIKITTQSAVDRVSGHWQKRS
jgi:hypothetical protein